MSTMQDLCTLTVKEIGVHLAAGTTTSVELVNLYLDRIEQDNTCGKNLRAVIAAAPRDLAISIAQSLDEERARRGPRGPLHGVPFLVNIATDPALGMKTTAGSQALARSVVPGDAHVVHCLREAGAIVIGKANLSELCNFRSPRIPWAYSEVGGQCSSAYFVANFIRGDGFDGPGNPSGSSSGSAVGVSAGFAPVALGTDTKGSILFPAHRAALFAICPTRRLVSKSGAVPISLDYDTAGPIGLSVYDVAAVLDVIVTPDASDETMVTRQRPLPYVSYTEPPYSNFANFRIGVPRAQLSLVDNKIRKSVYDAVAKMGDLGAIIIDPADMVISAEEREIFRSVFEEALVMGFTHSMNAYLGALIASDIRSVEELAAFNKASASSRQSPCHQDRIERALQSPGYGSAEHEKVKRKMEELAGNKGLDHVFDTYRLDALVSAVEQSQMTDFAAATGYTSGCVPLGYAPSNQPYGLMFVCRPGEESKLISLMAAYEQNFPARRPPHHVSLRGDIDGL